MHLSVIGHFQRLCYVYISLGGGTLTYNLIAAAVIFFTYSQNVFAQISEIKTEVESKEDDKKEAKVLEKIVVTGSYIRRADDEGAPSPVSVIDNTKAQEAGSFSASGALKDNALISGASTNQNGTTNVSFHGQSSANNLVLLNGLRLPKPAGGDSVNIDFIPASAIERIEVLKDGASALYGSEALAGVVNIITKKEYDGINVNLRNTTPQLGVGSESNIVATYGKNFKKGNILAVFQYRRNEPVMYRDTEYGITDLKRAGSTASSPANLQKGNTFYRLSDCPPEQTDKNGACRYDYYKTLPISNERDYYNMLVSGGYDLPNKLRVEGSVLLAHQKTLAVNTPKIINLDDLSAGGGLDYSLDPSTVKNLFNSKTKEAPLLNDDDKFKLSYSADEELGIERADQTLNNGTAQIKIGRQSDSFDWDFAVGYGASDYKEEVFDGNARIDILHQKIRDGSWNPFKPEGQKDSLRDAMIDTWNTNFADIWNARLIGSGPLIDLGAKSVYAAYGIEGQRQRYSFRADPLSLQNIPLTGLFSNQDGERNVSSVFLEFSQNPISRLQLQAALRMDRYSDFGSTVNPKLAAGYKITDKLSLRGSYGTGFKAPDLRSLYQGDVTRPQRIRDGVICSTSPLGTADQNCNNLFSTTTRGNANLQAERGQHWNFGLLLRPKKNWSLAVDHWRASGTEALESINLNRLTAAEAALGPSVLSQLGVTIQRDPNNVIQYILLPLRTNSGQYDMNGIDIDLKNTGLLKTPALGTLNYTFRMDHSHTLSSGSQPFFFQSYERQLDLNWRNVTSFTLAKNSHLTSLRARTFSARDKDDTRTNRSGGYGSIPIYTEYDLHYEYYGAWEGIITVGIRNLFDRKVFNELNRGGAGFLLPASETLLGRTLYVGYSQDF
jgi:iron complex outermembrane recepter protein